MVGWYRKTDISYRPVKNLARNIRGARVRAMLGTKDDSVKSGEGPSGSPGIGWREGSCWPRRRVDGNPEMRIRLDDLRRVSRSTAGFDWSGDSRQPSLVAPCRFCERFFDGSHLVVHCVACLHPNDEPSLRSDHYRRRGHRVVRCGSGCGGGLPAGAGGRCRSGLSGCRRSDDCGFPPGKMAVGPVQKPGEATVPEPCPGWGFGPARRSLRHAGGAGPLSSGRAGLVI